MDTGTLTDEKPVTTAPAYQRRNIEFFMGIAEPVAGDWHLMAGEPDRLLADGFNTVTLAPPVNITARAGGQPRIILEGEASSAELLMDDFHEKGLAVFISPTTMMSGFSAQMEPTPINLEHLKDDAVRWAEKAEAGQAELFAPLSDVNLVLGTDAALEWCKMILPLVRENYSGPVGAKVVPDLSAAPVSGQPHDFEKLDYRGYDYLMLDVFPRGDSYDAQEYERHVTEILDRANQVAQRDRLKGVIVSEFGSWRDAAGVDGIDGPILGPEAQAEMVDSFLGIAIPRTKGVFFQGWTLPGRGARDFPVEDVLKKYFVR